MPCPQSPLKAFRRFESYLKALMYFKIFQEPEKPSGHFKRFQGPVKAIFNLSSVSRALGTSKKNLGTSNVLGVYFTTYFKAFGGLQSLQGPLKTSRVL